MERNIAEDSKLVAALIEVQKEIGPLAVNHDLFGGARYLDLAGILQVVRPILAEHGVLLQQTADVVIRDDKTPGVLVITELLNSSGEFIRCAGKLGATDMNKANSTQKLGASISYLRRFQAMTVLGIAGAEDDDETDFTERTAQQTQPAQPAQGSGDQMQSLRDAIKDLATDGRLTDKQRLDIKAACANARTLSALQGVLNDVQSGLDERGTE